MGKKPPIPTPLLVLGGLVAGGAIGAGVGVGLYPPTIAVGAAIAVGLTLGFFVRRRILAAKAGSRPVLVLPGLYNSGPEHWQSRWEAAHPEFRRVMQDEWERPRCADWAARLDEAIRTTPDAVLVAHSSSCALVAHWVRAGMSGRVHAALLVAPSDPEAPSYPEGPTGFAPMPLVRLPFPTIIVASTDDEYVTLDRARAFADAWGSRLVTVGNAGHINSQSGLGDWPAGFALLEELRRR